MNTTPAILVVEDERIVAKDLQQTLKSLGYDAFAIASSAEEAIRLAAERCPDVALVDIRIKGDTDGVETAAILRRRFGVAVIYLTAHADAATLDRAKQTQPHGYLLKPVKSAELRSAVEVSLFRHEMEKRLRERERWLVTTLRAIGDAVISTDAESRVTFLNPVAELLTGWRNEDALGRPLEEVLQLVSESERTPVAQPIRDALRDGKIVERSKDLLLLAKGGGERPIADSAAPVIDGNEVLGAVMVFRDVSEQRRIQRQLEFADRLASLGTMAAGVAHEVNNPLAVIVANLSLVADALETKRVPLRRACESDRDLLALLVETDTALADARHAADRIREIVADLGVFARPAETQGRSADVARVVEWSIQTTQSELNPRARVRTEIDDVPPVAVAEYRLVQVLVNLLINAAHSITPGNVEANEVRIRAQRRDEATVVLEIQDTGCGIPRESLRRIFDPFFTTKGPRGGTGLGLSVCHGIVRSVGGDIEVESDVGKGTIFRISLPVSPAPAVRAKRPPRVGARRGRILIVDDEPMVLKAVSRILSKEHDVTSARSARRALARLETGERFDVILLDLMMPEMTGIEFYGQLLEADPGQARRIVFTSGGVTTVAAEEFLASVPNRFLRKPVAPETLLETVGEMVEAG